MTFSRTRLRMAGVAAVAGVAASIAQALVTPAGLDGSTRQMVAAAGAHTAAAYLAGWFEMISFALAALACITVTGLVTAGRGRRLTQVGGWLTTVSFLCLGFNTIGVVQAALAAGNDPSAGAHAIDQINSSPALAPLLVLLFGGLLFPVILGVGLLRARLVGWWYVAASVLAVPAFMLGSSDSVPVRLAVLVPVAVQWGTWTWLLRTSEVTDTAPGASPNHTESGQQSGHEEPTAVPHRVRGLTK